MQLVAEVSIPNKESESSIELTPARLRKLRRKGLSLEWYVLLAIEMTYSHKNPSIVKEHFCEQWGIVEYEFDAAVAKLQKKGELYRPSETVQLELFTTGEQQP